MYYRLNIYVIDEIHNDQLVDRRLIMPIPTHHHPGLYLLDSALYCM